MTQEKVAAITGSRRGIGRAIALAMANAGYSVVLSGVTSEKDSAEIVDDFSRSGHLCHYIKCDISDTIDRENFFQNIADRYGRLDLLVNNGGVAPKNRSDILNTTEESYDYVLNTNLRGTFFMCQKAANMMLDIKKTMLPDFTPRIINISSISSYTSSTNRAEYCISKSGVSMITKLFADRLASSGIPVFEISPGIIETDMTAVVSDKYRRLISNGLTPVPKMGKPEDVAKCVLAAAGGLLDFAVGQTIHADGGFHLRRL